MCYRHVYRAFLPEKLCRMALDMLDRDPAMLGGGAGLCDYLLTQSRIPAEAEAVTDRTALVELLCNGLSVLLIDDVSRAVAFSTQEMPQRAVSTPTGEGNLRGLRRPSPSCCAIISPCCGGNSAPVPL